MTDDVTRYKRTIEALRHWYAEYPWERSQDERAGSGDWDCYACSAHVDLGGSETREPGWWKAQPEADSNHYPDCPWVETKQVLKELERDA